MAAAAAVVVVVAESMTTDRKLILHDLSVEGMYKSYKEKTFLGICVVKKYTKIPTLKFSSQEEKDQSQISSNQSMMNYKEDLSFWPNVGLKWICLSIIYIIIT